MYSIVRGRKSGPVVRVFTPSVSSFTGVMSVLDGETVAVIQDRPPYGNMIMVETPLERLPESWLEMLAPPEPGMKITLGGTSS